MTRDSLIGNVSQTSRVLSSGLPLQPLALSCCQPNHCEKRDFGIPVSSVAQECTVHLHNWDTVVILLLSTEMRTVLSSSSDAVLTPRSVRHVMDFVSSALCIRRSATNIGVARLASSPIFSTGAHIRSSISPALLASLSSSVGKPFWSVNAIVVPFFPDCLLLLKQN